MTQDLFIDHVGAQGDGVALVDGNPIYIPGTLPGEQVIANVSGDRGKLVRVVEPSPDRVEPPCRHFRDCGGCTLQHMADPAMGVWKAERVRRALSHKGLEAAHMDPIFTTPRHSRRRARLTAVKTRDRVVLGFNQRESHQVVDVMECPVLRPEIVAILPALRAVLDRLLKPGMRGTVQVSATDTGLDLLFDLPVTLDLPARETLGAFGNDADPARISWASWASGAASAAARATECVLEYRRPAMAFGSVTVTLPSGTFLQASTEAEAAMVAKVTHWVGDAIDPGSPTAVADLFSGLGTFSFPLANMGDGKRTQVMAYDGDGPAIDAMTAALRSVPGIQITGRRRDLFRDPLTPDELLPFNAVVIDPPRAGARAQVERLAQARVPNIVMVSCNPATFARDARALVDGGYTLQAIAPVDQFLWSADVELVALFRR